MESGCVKIDLLRDWNCDSKKGELSCTYPAPKDSKGYYSYGFVDKHDGAMDCVGWDGLYLTVDLADEDGVEVTVFFASEKPLRQVIKTAGAGKRELVLPFKSFPLEQCKEQRWQFVTGFQIITAGIVLKAEVRRREKVWALADIRGKSGMAGETVVYPVTVWNCSNERQCIEAVQVFEGWESMKAEISPKALALEPGEGQTVEVAVTVHDRMVPGGHENTRITWTANGDGSCTEILEFKTMRALPHPYIYHDRIGWQKVMEKIEHYPEFRPAFEEYQTIADQWEVKAPYEHKHYCYDTAQETSIMSAAYLYALTGEKAYARKIGEFLCLFSDPDIGYPKKLRGCSNSYVQEGHFFQHLAIPYDIIYDSGVLAEEDHIKIEKTFRIYMNTLDVHVRSGHISNWLLSELVGGLYCALSLQDMHMSLRFVFGNGGIIDQFRKGIFNDGWWHECSIGYNTWVSSMCLHTAHALRPFGYNLVHTHFQIPFNDEVSSTWNLQDAKVRFGMFNKKWGGNRKNYMCFRDLFDATLPFLDYRGVMFGICDSDEKRLAGVHFGSTYDLAYTYYQNPEYIPVIQRCEYKDPIFGHPELPECQPKSISTNAGSDNIGIAMLRSQTQGREQREQIQAVLRYGSHGNAHGHYDITNLLSVIRYGRSFYNPECCWWGYRHFMYKFYVQNSLTKNMVVVDGKMQEPADSRQILFYSGNHVQMAGIETTTRWAWPPYGGMIYEDDKCYYLEERCRHNGCSLPLVTGDGAPAYGEMTDFTEPVLQKRIMAVLDDYIVLFDYLKGEQEHRFDSLMQMKGYQGLEGEDVEYTGHTGQYTDNPISDGQFITDCNWYQVNGTSTARFCQEFTEADAGEALGSERSNYNEPGNLHMDVHTAWPRKTGQMVGTMAVCAGLSASCGGYHIPCSYRVEADGGELDGGAFGAWLLGKGICNVDISGKKSLSLISRHEPMYNDCGDRVKTPQALFWGEAWVELSDGTRKKLAELPLEYENIDKGYGIGKDYMGGRVTLIGEEYPDAIPASTLNHEEDGIIRIDLEGMDASRLYACIGADVYPGDESQMRKTYAVQSYGQVGHYVTVIEPYEKEARVASVQSSGPDQVSVVLSDGSRQEITITKMEGVQPEVKVSGYDKWGGLLWEENSIS